VYPLEAAARKRAALFKAQVPGRFLTRFGVAP
jgi:hypothetical protein